MTRTSFLFAAFFVSGFCSLVYQVVWLRMALASFGVITPVISVVLSTFMLGLSVGSWMGGRWIDRLSRSTGRSGLLFYGLAEFLIGLGGLVVPWLFSAGERHLLSLGATDSTPYLIRSGIVIAVSILPWCVCMGATFPTMMAFIKQVDRGQRTSFSFLYLANVIGAAFGAGLTAIVFVELMGFTATLRLAVILNFGLGAACMLAARHHAPAATSPAAVALADSPAGPRLPALVLFATGFASMANEVVWTRAFTPVLETTVYAFAALLVTYLLATGIGSFLYRRAAGTARVASMGRLLGLLVVSAFLPVVSNDPRLHANALVTLMSIVPFCGLLGFVTPRLIDEFSDGEPGKAGFAYAINVIGCILGPLCAGYGMLPWLGVRQSLVVLATPMALLYVASFGTWSDRTAFRVGCLGLTAALLAMSLGFVRSYEDPEMYARSEVRRDYTATVVSSGEDMDKHLLVNGVGMTGLTVITKIMAHSPLAHLAARPRSILVICFGMGTTYRSALTWDVDVTAVELVPSVRDAFGYYFDDAPTFLNDPKGRIVIDDGRRFLMRTDRTFDVITVDPPPPVEAAASSLLYSREFYQIIKKRLSENGILQHWIPDADPTTIDAVIRSLQEEFPHVVAEASPGGWGYHLMASRQPLPVRTAEQLVERMPPRARMDLMEWYPGRDPAEIFSILLKNERTPRPPSDPDRARALTDDRPINEYYLLRRAFGSTEWMGVGAAVITASVVGFALFLIVQRPK